MLDAPTPGARASVDAAAPRPARDVLLVALADAAVATAGVVRLEPTLSTAGPGVLVRRSPTDGVRLLDRAGVADVDVNIVTTAARQAREVSHHVRAEIVRVLVSHGYTPGSVTVSVLTVDPADAASTT